jgi:hypothetical protein
MFNECSPIFSHLSLPKTSIKPEWRHFARRCKVWSLTANALSPLLVVAFKVSPLKKAVLNGLTDY